MFFEVYLIILKNQLQNNLSQFKINNYDYLIELIIMVFKLVWFVNLIVDDINVVLIRVEGINQINVFKVYFIKIVYQC